MPDREKRTVSASQVAALFGESPYQTRFSLYHSFVSGTELPREEDERMEWGRKMQPLIIEKAQRDLNLVVEANDSDTYVRRGPLGCTRDAIVIHPERGPGALEVKCVFDYKVWMEKWGGGSFVPREYEIQLQAQCFVGDGEHAHGGGGAYGWGVIAVWVCAHQYYFQREPNTQLWQAMESEASKFLADVAHRREPDPTGLPLELPLIYELYPTVQGKVLDLRDSDEGPALRARAERAEESHQAASIHDGVYKSIRAEFIALMKDAETVLLPDGANVRLGSGNRIKFHVPPVAVPV